MAAGLVAAGCFLLGALVGQKVLPPAWTEPPEVAALSLASAIPSPRAVADSPVPSVTPGPASTPTRTPAPTLMAAPTPSPTPTPSPPPTTLVVPSPFPTPNPGSVAVLSSTLPIPMPVQPVPVASNTVNIVVLGSDRRPDWSEWHTDAVHVVSIQTDRAAVSVISIPRDLYVYIPGFWMSRVNFADFYGEGYEYPGGGSALLRDTLLYNLGIRVDYIVRTDFDGLIGIVDTLGGVDIPVHCRLSDHWPYANEEGEYPILTLEPGVHHLDGETALWYARSRLTTSVFSRERRQQQVLQAIWHRVRDAGMLTQIPALWEQVRDMVETDMDFATMLELAQVALRLQDQNIRFYNIGPDEVTPWTTPYGGSVFLPRWEAIEPVVAEAMAPIPEARLNRTFMPVEVWNGTRNADWGLLAADRLLRAGFPAVVGEAERRDYGETQLVVFSEYAKG
ncbi:MAG TPA: hypothetical protein ENI37_08255, partial [Chloroflexi bacterium]|nr:hypothetical protein [Chloroflexota bacterium]